MLPCGNPTSSMNTIHRWRLFAPNAVAVLICCGYRCSILQPSQLAYT